MEIRPDYSQVKNDFEPVPEGQYFVRVDSFKTEKRKNGMPQVNWTLKIFGDKHFSGRLLFLNTTVGGDHAFILRNFVAAVIPGYKSGPFKTEDVVGGKLEITVVHEKGEKGTFANVRRPLPYIEQGSTGSFAPGAPDPFVENPGDFGAAPTPASIPRAAPPQPTQPPIAGEDSFP